MQYKTLATLRSKVELDLDLQEELFITSAQVNDFLNEGIKDVEAEVHTLYEDYFLTSSTLSLVSGTSVYSLPTDIYANKIRRVIYSLGSYQYEIPHLKDRDGFIEGVILNQYPTSYYYKYRLTNPSASGGIKLVLYPAAQETSTNVTIWYIREANALSIDTDKCDIPEFSNYIVQFAKCRCYEKEPGHPNYAAALGERERLRQLMLSTLQSMIPDGDNCIEMDVSHYEDMS